MSFTAFFDRLNGRDESPAIVATIDPEPAAVIHADTDADERRRRYLRLEAIEKRLDSCEMSWLTLGKDLWEIHRDRLYVDRADTFEEYLADRLEMSAPQGLAYIRAAKTAYSVRDVSHRIGFGAMLKLSKVPEAKRATCLSEAIAAAGSRRPTAKQIAEAAARYIDKPKRPRKAKKWKTERVRLAMGEAKLSLPLAADLREFLRAWLDKLTAPSQTPATS